MGVQITNDDEAIELVVIDLATKARDRTYTNTTVRYAGRYAYVSTTITAMLPADQVREVIG